MLTTDAREMSRLADVLVNACAALRGEGPLPPARAAIVVLIDGLGHHNLAERAGHARFLARHLPEIPDGRTGLPSTTAAALATLTTGLSPGQHGMLGYRVRVPESGALVNQLTGWDRDELPADWFTAETISQRAAATGLPSTMVAAPRYRDTGFTRAIFAGMTAVAAPSVTERCTAALRSARNASGLVYCYIPELDQIGHSHGWRSSAWSAALETVDAALADLAASLPHDVGLLVTADHGMIDVPRSGHHHLDHDPELLAGVAAIAGEPRCVALTLDQGADAAALAVRWRDRAGECARVVTRAEAIDSELFGPVAPAILPRLADLFVLAQGPTAWYDSRADRTAEGMVGQHGSDSDLECDIPILRLGAFQP